MPENKMAPLPCPFCGNTEIEYWDGDDKDNMFYCEPCGLCGPRGIIYERISMTEDAENKKQDALEKWNALPRNS